MIIVNCPVCSSDNGSYYIATNALMHKANQERYVFNKCSSCQAVFLTNPVKEEVLDTYYTDNYLPYKGAAAWGRYSSFVAKSQQTLDFKRVQVVARYLKSKKEFTILDVGCGNPSFLNLAIQKLNAEGTGIDFSENGWKNQSFDKLRLIKTSIADFKPSCSFDVITLWHYLEHDYNLQETVNKLYDCLNTGGKLIIEVPDYNSISARKQEQYWQGWHSPRHLTLFSEKSFQVLFKSDKWKIIDHHKYGTLDAFTLWWLGKMEQQQINWSDSMESKFWHLVFLKAISFPFFLFEKFFPMGIQLVVIEKK